MLSNKRVCVIGIGNSGADIVTELGRLNENVHLVSRSGAHVFDLRGVPLTSMVLMFVTKIVYIITIVLWCVCLGTRRSINSFNGSNVALESTQNQ